MSKSYHCPSCGAEFVLNDKNILKECLYCGCLISVIQKDIRSLNINKIIPFDISLKKAKTLVKSSINLFSFTKIIHIKKIYVPALFMNCDVDYVVNYEYSTDNGTFEKSNTISGKMYNQILPMAKIKYDCILGSDSFSMNKIRDVNILDVEEPIECCTLNASISDIAHEKVREKCKQTLQANLENKIVKIIDEQCFVNNLKKTEYLTLLPFYLVTLSDDTIFLLNGSSYTNVNKKNKINYYGAWFLCTLISYFITFLVGALGFFDINDLYFVLFKVISVVTIIYIVIYLIKKNKKFKNKNNIYYFDYKIFK